MDANEFESNLNDIETRLDRLKALYEQWFQGIERIEPQIPRKEVDRRLALLRREHPRNTGLRFRFQQIIQRYTTLSTYWQRVARQIEEGTYRRDVMRLREKRIAARNRSTRPSAPPRADSTSRDLGLEFEDEIDNALSVFDDAMSGSDKGPDTMPSPAPTSEKPVSIPTAARAPSINATFARPRASSPPTTSVAPKPATPSLAPRVTPPVPSLTPRVPPPPPPSLAPRVPPLTKPSIGPANTPVSRPIPPPPPPSLAPRVPPLTKPSIGPANVPVSRPIPPPPPKPPTKK